MILSEGSQRVLLVADTHSEAMARPLDALQPILKRVSPDLIVHLGDVTEPRVIEWLKMFAPTELVQGYNDPPELNGHSKLVIELEGWRLGFTHGDRSVRRELPSKLVNRLLTRFHRPWWNGFYRDLQAKFAEDHVQCIVCGHLHYPFIKREGAMLLLSPGAVYMSGRGYQQNCPSIGLLEISRHELRAQNIPLPVQRPYNALIEVNNAQLLRPVAFG